MCIVYCVCVKLVDRCYLFWFFLVNYFVCKVSEKNSIHEPLDQK